MSHPQRRYSVTPTGHLDKHVGAQLRLGLDWVDPADGCEFEFLIDWRPLEPGRPWSPEITMFDDSWQAFKEWPDVFSWFAANVDKRPSLEQVIEAMKGLGFVDYHASSVDLRAMVECRACGHTKGR